MMIMLYYLQFSFAKQYRCVSESIVIGTWHYLHTRYLWKTYHVNIISPANTQLFIARISASGALSCLVRHSDADGSAEGENQIGTQRYWFRRTLLRTT